MNYEVTALKKRPQSFDELVGQEFIVSTLANSVKQGRVANAYLFSGPRGVGKTSAARILAKSLNCEQGLLQSPCGTCTSCREITMGNSLDVIEIDGASHTSVNDVREIKDEVLFSPSNSKYKIYIIDEVHMLSNSAFNALLKTIEEPPPYVVFIFATTEIHKVPATIRSRCQQFNFRLISISEISEKLKEAARELKIKTDKESLLWIAKESTGSMRDAYTLFDQIVSFSENDINIKKIHEKLGIVGLDEIAIIVSLLAEGKSEEVLNASDTILSKGISEEQLLISLTEFFRNLLFLKNGITKESILGYSKESFQQELVEAFTLEQIEKALELLLDLYRNFRFSLNPKYELELLLNRLSRLKTLIVPSEILHMLNDLREQIFSSSREHRAAEPSQNAIQEENRDSQEAVNVVQKIIDTIGRKKLTLATALSKCVSWELKDSVLTIFFKEEDKFSQEFVTIEKTNLSQLASTILSYPVSVKIELVQHTSAENADVDENEMILKKVFKGNVVRGE